MFFETLEAEYLEKIRMDVDLPHGEARARLQRERDLRDDYRNLSSALRHSWRRWTAAARLRLGAGLIGAGVWLAGRRGEML